MSRPELWRPIPGFAGYEISDRLQVRSRWSTSGALRPAPRVLRPLWEADRRGARVRIKQDSGGFITVRVASLCRLALGLSKEVA
jgi:hypothetical protein